MNRKFQVKVIPSSWINENKRRLDCRPYVGGAIEATHLLRELETHALEDLLENSVEGMMISPYFKRIYVDDAQYSIPLLGNSDILMTDCQLCADKLALSIFNKYKGALALKEGATLITCFGTVGNLSYCRSDMAKCAASTNYMRLLPDSNAILPGFLFAFLSCKYGISLVTQNETGSVIPNLLPIHISKLPVPRLGAVEQQTHDLVQRAADLRVEAARLLNECSNALNGALLFPEKLALSHRSFSCTTAYATQLVKRMDATYYDAVAQKTDEIIAALPEKDLFSALGVQIGETGRLKQIFVDDEFGVPFLTSGEIFKLNYSPTRFLSKRLLPPDDEWAIAEGDILLARSGQVGGIIGRGVWADRRFVGGCVSVDAFRIRTGMSLIPAGYLFAYLCLTDVGYRQLIRTAAGSSIPHLSASDILKLLIPRCPKNIEKHVDENVRSAGEMRADAQDCEDQARALVENAIEEGG